MKKGDYIYYKDKSGDTFPGTILSVKEKVKIKINYSEKELYKTMWVNKSNIELQNVNT